MGSVLFVSSLSFVLAFVIKVKQLWLKVFIVILILPELPLLGFVANRNFEIWPLFLEYLSDPLTVNDTLYWTSICNFSFFLSFGLILLIFRLSPDPSKKQKEIFRSNTFGVLSLWCFAFYLIFKEIIAFMSYGGYYTDAMVAASGSGPNTFSYFVYGTFSIYLTLGSRLSGDKLFIFAKVLVILLFAALILLTGNRESFPFVAFALIPASWWTKTGADFLAYLRHLLQNFISSLSISRRALQVPFLIFAMLLFLLHVGLTRNSSASELNVFQNLLSSFLPVLSISIIPNILAAGNQFNSIYGLHGSDYFYRLIVDTFLGSHIGANLIGGPLNFNVGLVFYPIQFGGSHFTFTSVIPRDLFFAIGSQALLGFLVAFALVATFRLFPSRIKSLVILVCSASFFLSFYSPLTFFRIILASLCALFLSEAIVSSGSTPGGGRIRL